MLIELSIYPNLRVDARFQKSSSVVKVNSFGRLLGGIALPEMSAKTWKFDR